MMNINLYRFSRFLLMICVLIFMADSMHLHVDSCHHSPDSRGVKHSQGQVEEAHHHLSDQVISLCNNRALASLNLSKTGWARQTESFYKIPSMPEIWQPPKYD